MSRIDFVLSNTGHHVEMMLPVVERLTAKGHDCRVLSLCELRGFRTPCTRISAAGATPLALVPRVRGSSSAGSQSRSAAVRSLREMARALAWHSMLGPRFRAQWKQPVDAVILPNDAAFPYDRIATVCRHLRQPMLLLQEGIRFPLPVSGGPDRYGLGGAAAVAAWGEASASFFRDRGVPSERVRVTGSPRFDLEVPGRSAAPPETGLGPSSDHCLLLATNPIDDQGFCTTAEKLSLIERFLDAVEPLVVEDRVQLMVRWHGRESSVDYERLLETRSWCDRVVRANDMTLSQALATASAVVVLATTVGLEALAARRRLGVLEIPGSGHVFDYVSEGVATPLSWSDDPTSSLRSLLSGPVDEVATAGYVERHLGPRHGPTRFVTELILEVIAGA